MLNYLKCPLTNGLFFVLFIWASNGTSKYWLIVLAEADVKAVPTEHTRKVSTSNAPGAMAYPAMDVSTTKPKWKKKARKV